MEPDPSQRGGGRPGGGGARRLVGPLGASAREAGVFTRSPAPGTPHRQRVLRPGGPRHGGGDLRARDWLAGPRASGPAGARVAPPGGGHGAPGRRAGGSPRGARGGARRELLIRRSWRRRAELLGLPLVMGGCLLAVLALRSAHGHALPPARRGRRVVSATALGMSRASLGPLVFGGGAAAHRGPVPRGEPTPGRRGARGACLRCWPPWAGPSPPAYAGGVLTPSGASAGLLLRGPRCRSPAPAQRAALLVWSRRAWAWSLAPGGLLVHVRDEVERDHPGPPAPPVLAADPPPR